MFLSGIKSAKAPEQPIKILISSSKICIRLITITFNFGQPSKSVEIQWGSKHQL